jgi:protein-disulfide isomerase
LDVGTVTLILRIRSSSAGVSSRPGAFVVGLLVAFGVLAAGVVAVGVLAPGVPVVGVLVAPGVVVAGVPGAVVAGVPGAVVAALSVTGVLATGAVLSTVVATVESELEPPLSFTSAAASTPSESAATLASTAIGTLQLGVAARRVRAAAPQFKHHSCSG